jgi:hypothetical protein
MFNSWDAPKKHQREPSLDINEMARDFSRAIFI